jgi:two-component system cell cycle sensor histidine kinase/response regulator CckA
VNDYRLGDLLDLKNIQNMAEAHFRAAGMPIGIIDAMDGSILVGAGWQDICVKYHRGNPVSLQRCRESDDHIKAHLAPGEACAYKCQNGLWDIGLPIIVAGYHLATMFLGQFFYKDEAPDREFFTQQARQFGFDTEGYLAALDRVPILSRQRVASILEYNKALVGFIAGLAENATSRIKAEQETKQQAEFLQMLIDVLPYPLFYKDRQGRYLSCNRAFGRLFGTSRDQIAGKTVYDIAPRELADAYQQADDALFAQPGKQMYESTIQSSDGARREVLIHKATFEGTDGALAGIVGAMVDITDRKRMQSALQASEAKLRSILDNLEIGVALISPAMQVLEANQRMRQWYPGIALEQCPVCYQVFNAPPRRQPCDSCPTFRTLQDGLSHESTTQIRRAGNVRSFRVVSSPIHDASGQVTAAIELVEDITDKLSLEAQLRQAQKMEAVGRLAGGVAHDFNNMLGVIMGYAELAMKKADPAQPLRAELEQICTAARRSSEIIRQLLAFARKQTIAPKTLDLNDTVEGMLKMLRRLIGEDIDLVWHADSGLWPVKMDPTQIEQILANLCVNARDAITGVGKVTIETTNITFNQAYCADHPGFKPGKYAMLAVSDDGYGMEAETLDKIFEPFFTTKEVGQGTGLGLATVYGIVKQNDGFINVYSEKEKGTTFKIYLPPSEDRADPLPAEISAELLQSTGETVLVVEDEEAVLNLACRLLDGMGYHVLSAASPDEALRQAEAFAGPIHLLLTDVILPKMNGRELAEKIKAFRPAMKCLFMSGYTANVIAHRGMLDEGVQFIAKPFSMQELSAKARTALGKNE